MQEINVTFFHPTNGSSLEVSMDKSLSAEAILSELIACGFINDNSMQDGYRLLVMETNMEISGKESISSGDGQNDFHIQIIPTTCAGGGFEYFVDLWQTLYPYLDQVGTVLGIAGVAISFGVWVKNKFGNIYTPKQFTEKITNKELWNVHELAVKLGITDNEAKNLLKGFGYKWDRHLSLYVKTETTVEILEKMEQADF